MYRKISMMILAISIIPAIIAGNDSGKSNNSSQDASEKEPSINVSLNAVSVGFSNSQRDSLGEDSLSIKQILLMAENYCQKQNINFPIKESKITISINPDNTGTGLEIKVYFWHNSHKLLKIIINNREKVSTHTISDWFFD